MNKLYRAGLYCRLSVDDANNSAKAKNYIPADESVSIENQEALAKGAILPDCGVYFAERMRSSVEPGMEKVIESNPADYALCVVILENREAQA